MEPTQKRECWVFFVRHGERLDQVPSIPPGMKVDFKYDPPLTLNGMRQAASAA